MLKTDTGSSPIKQQVMILSEPQVFYIEERSPETPPTTSLPDEENQEANHRKAFDYLGCCCDYMSLCGDIFLLTLTCCCSGDD